MVLTGCLHINDRSAWKVWYKDEARTEDQKALFAEAATVLAMPSSPATVTNPAEVAVVLPWVAARAWIALDRNRDTPFAVVAGKKLDRQMKDLEVIGGVREALLAGSAA